MINEDEIDNKVNKIIERAGDISDVMRLPMAHPPVVTTLRDYASRFLYDPLKAELGDVVPKQYNPGNDKHDPYHVFDKINEFAQKANRDVTEVAVKTVVTAFCKAAQCEYAEEQDSLLKEASDFLGELKQNTDNEDKPESSGLWGWFRDF